MQICKLLCFCKGKTALKILDQRTAQRWSDHKDQLRQGTSYHTYSGSQVPGLAGPRYQVDLVTTSWFCPRDTRTRIVTRLTWVLGTRSQVPGGWVTTTWLCPGDTRLTLRQQVGRRLTSASCLGLCFAPARYFIFHIWSSVLGMFVTYCALLPRPRGCRSCHGASWTTGRGPGCDWGYERVIACSM